MFGNDHVGDLVYSRELQDLDRPSNETGHIELMVGDSGSPLWLRETNDQNYVIALVSNGAGQPSDKAHGYFGNNPNHNCRFAVTKITEAMSDWFRERNNYVW